jgi:serine/threonine protein kinase
VTIEDINEEDIFRNAIEFEGRDEQADYVKMACGDNTELCAAVEALLRHHYQSSILDAPALESSVLHDTTPITEGPGTTIGRYKLLEKIGEGGMAVVYMAEQTEPIRRKVALKIIKLGMDTKSVIARFEAERQALAMMDHPNIAKVLDAGATETGRPYFVMELVTGVSITEYCDKNNLSTKERLALFIQVCNAVQHAHQKGIIHRDIKPTNVMVTRHEGRPIPKVIDFGIAKATNQKLTEKTLFTRYSHIIGTPAYMSPEQADLGDMDVDTRSDIYSLGVLLYELLTGTTPFSEEELRKAGYLEMQRVIREQEPPKPSTKLSTLGETLTDIAKYHGCTPDLLIKSIRGDMDWIVMKSLEKGRERRYDTVSALASDIRRYLNDELILARAPSTIYRLHKFFRRHWFGAVAALVVFVLAVGLLSLLAAWKNNQRRLDSEMFLRDRITLDVARMVWVSGGDVAALAEVELILDSEYVGDEAKSMYDKILADVQEQVNHYSSIIEVDPEDPVNYLNRAQYHKSLGHREDFLADMKQYIALVDLLDETHSQSNRIRELFAGLLLSTPKNCGPNINTPYKEWGPNFSPDGLSLLFTSTRPGGQGAHDIWVARRKSKTDPWGKAVNLGPPVNSETMDGYPTISPDGKQMVFSSRRSGGIGETDLWLSTRVTVDGNWGEPVHLGSSVNSPYQEVMSNISADGLEMFFSSNRPDGFGIWVTKRATEDGAWGAPVPLGTQVGGPTLSGGYPSISPDGLLLFFASYTLKGRLGQDDIWVTTRLTKDEDWGPPVNLGPSINTSGYERSPRLSPEGCTLYFASNRPGGFGDYDIWEISITSVPVDLQEDGRADSSKITIEEDNHGKEVMSNENNLSGVSMGK